LTLLLNFIVLVALLLAMRAWWGRLTAWSERYFGRQSGAAGGAR